jgi:ATP-dependent helicase STH1/SNF2
MNARLNALRRALVQAEQAAREGAGGEDDGMSYIRSRKRFYDVAHRVKEDVKKQPSLLRGGDLREYQMQGLNWLVSRPRLRDACLTAPPLATARRRRCTTIA